MRVTLATRVTFIRVLLVIPFMYAALKSGSNMAGVALFIFLVASFTDYLDGKLARGMNEVTTLGKFVDQLADKVLIDAALLIFLQKGDVGSWFVITVITRDIAVSGLRMVAASKSRVIAASWWGKVKTVSQMAFVIATLLYNITPFLGQTLNSALMWIAFAMTIWSGIDYFIKNSEALEE